MKLGTETGSMSNYLMSGTKGQPEPAIGMGCTFLAWSDRTAGTIVGVERFKTGNRAGKIKSVTMQYDTATRTDKNGMSESQEYQFRFNPDGAMRTFKVNSKGAFVCDGGQLRIGSRDHYHDYSF